VEHRLVERDRQHQPVEVLRGEQRVGHVQEPPARKRSELVGKDGVSAFGAARVPRPGQLRKAVARSVTAPTLVLDGGASLPFLRDAATVLAAAMPSGTRRTLDGQTHLHAPETVAPVLAAFFG
jgi:hypothetical protein